MMVYNGYPPAIKHGWLENYSQMAGLLPISGKIVRFCV
jgi:hypothetical protein